MLTKKANEYKVENWFYSGRVTSGAFLNPLVVGTQVSWKEVRIQNIETELVGLAFRVGKIEENLNKVKFGSSVQIYDLEDLKYGLNFPISLILTKEDDMFYAEAVDFNLFGIGGDEKFAIRDLKEVLVIYYEGLTSSEKKLNKKLRKKLRLLRQIISTK